MLFSEKVWRFDLLSLTLNRNYETKEIESLLSSRKRWYHDGIWRDQQKAGENAFIWKKSVKGRKNLLEWWDALQMWDRKKLWAIRRESFFTSPGDIHNPISFDLFLFPRRTRGKSDFVAIVFSAEASRFLCGSRTHDFWFQFEHFVSSALVLAERCRGIERLHRFKVLESQKSNSSHGMKRRG